MNELALFAGAGGGILGGALLGWRTICACEIDGYAREVLLARQRDGSLPEFPIWDDVRSFDGRPWRGCVDVVSGGFPCQDISAAGKGAGIEGERSGLWKEMCRIIREVRPKFAFMENSPMLTSRGLGTVLGDLAEAGYDAEWMVLGAVDVGAPHRRERIWILARDSMAGDADGEHELPEREVWGGEVAGPCGVCEGMGEHPEDCAEWGGFFSYSDVRRAGWGQQQPKSTATPTPDADANSMQCAECGSKHEGPEELDGRGAHGVDAGGDLADAECGRWDAECGTLARSATRAPDQSDRHGDAQGEIAADSDMPGCEKQWRSEPDPAEYASAERGCWWQAEPRLGRVADGVAHRVDRLRAIGNGQVPLVAATAFCELKRRFE